MKKLLTLLGAWLVAAPLCFAQVDQQKEFFSLPDTVTNAYLDSVKVNVKAPNDYWMVGVYGGASLQYGYYNPTRLVDWQLKYPVFNFTYTDICLIAVVKYKRTEPIFFCDRNPTAGCFISFRLFF